MTGEQWRRWTPAAQEKFLSKLNDVTSNAWRPFYCNKFRCDGKPHNEWGFPHARADQHPPPGDDWLTWAVIGGRGSGKTRTGAEWVNRVTKVAGRIALIGATGPDIRDTVIEGESGILATSPPGERPEWEPSKRKLTWRNGAIAMGFSAEEPDRLRGPQHAAAWADEPAHYPLIEDVWSNLLFGLRLGRNPHVCVTTTPLPTKWMKALLSDPTTVKVGASTYANISNLPEHFAKIVLDRYEGTRLGLQEIHGEILSDVEGALWKYEYFDGPDLRVDEAPDRLDRVVVAVDPAGTQRKKSDETGIIVSASKDAEFYVLADRSGKFSPRGWAERAVAAYHEFGADAIVVETNYGGDMVRSTLESVDQSPRIIEVTSRRGKVIRADPIVALYEKSKVHHVGKNLGDLEDQLVSWVPGSESPDRLDALVHGLTELAKVTAPSTIASPSQLRAMMHSARLGPASGPLGIVRTG